MGFQKVTAVVPYLRTRYKPSRCNVPCTVLPSNTLELKRLPMLYAIIRESRTDPD